MVAPAHLLVAVFGDPSPDARDAVSTAVAGRAGTSGARSVGDAGAVAPTSESVSG